MDDPIPDCQSLSRTDVRTQACPACHAPADEPCIGARRKPRESNHMERVKRAVRIGRLTAP